jgi:hypothetical protein
MQETVINVLFIAVLVVIAATLFWDVRKKRNRLKVAQREEVELTENLQSKLPEGYTVLTDVYLLTKVGRSRADFVILCPYGIFALEYRQFYVYIRADEEASRWTYAPGIKGKPFTSPLYQSKIHLHCIQELIGDKPGLKCYPMVAFPTVAEIELQNPTDTAFVGLVTGVLPFIEKWQDEVCLTADEISAIAELLSLNSEKVKEMEKPEPAKEAPEEYKAFIPGDFRDPEEDDEDWEEDDDDEQEPGSEEEDRDDAEGTEEAEQDSAKTSDQDEDERR